MHRDIRYLGRPPQNTKCMLSVIRKKARKDAYCALSVIIKNLKVLKKLMKDPPRAP